VNEEALLQLGVVAPNEFKKDAVTNGLSAEGNE